MAFLPRKDKAKSGHMRQSTRIGIIGGLGNEAMLDIAEKLAKNPESGQHEYVFYGNSRLAYKPEEVNMPETELGGAEKRKHATAEHTSRLMQHFGCDVIGLACNSAHPLFRETLAPVPATFVDMLEQTADSMPKTENPILVMGVTSLVDSGLYQEALHARGLTAVKASTENQKKIMSAIYDTSFGIKTGRTTFQAKELLCEVVRDECERQGCDTVVLGCTELPIAFSEQNIAQLRKDGMLPEHVRIIDATSVLAQALLCAEGTGAPLNADISTFMNPDVDWFAPAAFHVDTLAQVCAIQKAVFDHTVAFLAAKGGSVTGSYMHLPTLFLVGENKAAMDALTAMGITVFDATASLYEILPPIFTEHYDSMS